MFKSSEAQALAPAAFSRLIALIILFVVQQATTPGVMPVIQPGLPLFSYYVAVSLVTVAICWRLRSQAIICDLIDISVLELLFYTIALISYSTRNSFLYSIVVQYWNSFPSATFAMMLARIIAPPATPLEFWPSLGILGFKFKQKSRTSKANAGVLYFLSSLGAALVIAKFNRTFPPGWSRYALACTGSIVVAFWGQPMLAALVTLISAKRNAENRATALEIAMEVQRAAVAALTQKLEAAARDTQPGTRNDAEALLDNISTPEEKTLISALSILRPDTRAALTDYIVDIAKAEAESRKPNLELVVNNSSSNTLCNPDREVA